MSGNTLTTVKKKKVIGIWKSIEDLIYSIWKRQGYYSALAFMIRAGLTEDQQDGEDKLDLIIQSGGEVSRLFMVRGGKGGC
mgnify:CR=1 FL=1